MTEEILAAQKGFQQTALARNVIHNQDARRVRRRFGQFGWHGPSLDKSAGRQKKFSKADFNAKAQKCKDAPEKSQRDFIIQPRVVRNELPWVDRKKESNPNGVLSSGGRVMQPRWGSAFFGDVNPR
jgi:hypothetical protein